MILANGCNITVKNLRGSEYFPYPLYIYIRMCACVYMSQSATTVSETSSEEMKEIQKQSLLIHTGEARSHTHSTGMFRHITADKGS